MAEERGLVVDVDGFNNAMDEAREKSRSARNKVIGFWFVYSMDIFVYKQLDCFLFALFSD